jgi:hypothetical protein
LAFVVEALGQLMQLCGGGTQGIGAMTPNVGYDLVVDVSRERSQLFFDACCGLMESVLPGLLWDFCGHMRTPVYEYADVENPGSSAQSPYAQPRSQMVTQHQSAIARIQTCNRREDPGRDFQR